MSHCITLPSSNDFYYFNFIGINGKSNSNATLRVINNKNGYRSLSSEYSLKDRFIQFLSHIPWFSGLDFVSKCISLIKKEQKEAVGVFLQALKNEFGKNDFEKEINYGKEQPDYLKCKNISFWSKLAADSTINQKEISDINYRNRHTINDKLLSSYMVSPESANAFVKDITQDESMDYILNEINAILEKGYVPDSDRVSLRWYILEHLNINALDNKTSLKSISDCICELLMRERNTLYEKAPSWKKAFKLPNDISLTLAGKEMQGNSTPAGLILHGVASLKAYIQSNLNAKKSITDSLHTYTMRNIYMYCLQRPALCDDDIIACFVTQAE